ncbi:ABC transporter permease [Corynebacterium pseudopelargi]|uniref:ABC-2 family transporter protein n=1 Tax=Corynebacterium pseudopelargi TaxID=2080757 RepID=A0A3G6IUB9_9CORY|nr:ABC transporter permease [Corynebacterium pseudopelargi]AZA09223.1 ABC-2 family transporter protein [Corynebacterium pseudopelargi]
MATRKRTLDAHTFEPGTFSPNPARASVASMLRAQGVMEAKLFMRHGEQLLLSFIIPLAGLVGLYFFPVANTEMDNVVPTILAMAAMSSGFTGQAISLAFDRRYGALKRTGASGVPAWTIVLGKIIGVLAVSFVQLLLLGSTAMFLGWHPDGIGIVFGLILFFFGVATFTTFGLLMGGSLSSELVLGFANLLWFALVGVASIAMISPTPPSMGLELVPSVALADGLRTAFSGSMPGPQLVILAGYCAIGGLGASRWFKFN